MKSKKILLIHPQNIIEKIPQDFKKIHEDYYKTLIAYEKRVLRDKNIIIKEPEIDYNRLSRGLLCLATSLKQKELEPIYLSISIEHKKDNKKGWLKRVLKEKIKYIDVVGITAYTSNFKNAFLIAKTLKKIKPSLIIILGGTHATALGEEILKNKYFDIIVQGEGELIFPGLCKNLVEEKQIKDIPGIIYKENKKIIKNPNKELLKGENIPSPDYSILPKNYNFQYIIETSRGCPYRCSFCAETFFWKKSRFRDPKKVIEELNYIKSLGFNTIHICDPIFALNQDHLKSIIKEKEKQNLKMNFSCDIRLELLTSEKISLLRRLGVYKVFIGIESGSNKILKNMNKMVDFETYYQILKRIKGQFPYIDTSWLFGFPGENFKTVEETTKKMEMLFKEGLINGIWPKILVPYPGTPLFNRPDQFNLKIISKNWNNYNRNGYPLVYKIKSMKKKDIYYSFMDFLKRAYSLYKEDELSK